MTGPLNGADRLDAVAAEYLRARGVSPEAARKRGLHSMSLHHGTPTLEIPFYDASGKPINYTLIRPFHEHKRKGDKLDEKTKFLLPKGRNNHLYLDPDVPWPVVTADPAIPVVITEGPVKAIAAWEHGLPPTIALNGVCSWRTVIDEESVPLPDLDQFNWAGREVLICFDSDIEINKNVQRAADQLGEELLRRGANPKLIVVPAANGGRDKQGLDDFVVAHGKDAAEAAFSALERRLPKGVRVAVSRCLADIEPKSLDWIWEGHYARAMSSLLVGPTGLGKSQKLMDTAARITTGAVFPDGTPCRRGSVIFLNAEDDPARIIYRRAVAAGADLARIHILDAVRSGDVERPFHLGTDLQMLERLIQQIGDVALVVIDPVTAYLGGNIDFHRDDHVRSMVFYPLKQLAERRDVAVIGVVHMNKETQSTNATMRILGSVGVANAARAAWFVLRDPGDKDRRLFVTDKNNYGPEGTGLAFRIEELFIDGHRTSRVVWEPGSVEMTATEVLELHAERAHEGHSEVKDCAEWLRGQLSGGRVLVTEIEEQAAGAGYAPSTLRRARSKLDVRAVRDGFGKSPWYIKLPPTKARNAPPPPVPKRLKRLSGPDTGAESD